MQKLERVKIFKGTKIGKLEEEYAAWYKEETTRQKDASEVKKDLEIINRDISMNHTGKSLQVVIAVFYVDYGDANAGFKGDRGQHLDRSGASAFGRKAGPST